MNILRKKAALDKIIMASFLASLLLDVASLVFIIAIYSRLPIYLPLFNQMPWGALRLGTKEQIFIPLYLGTGIFIFNVFIAFSIYEKMPLISRIISVTTLLALSFVLLFIIKIIQLVL